MRASLLANATASLFLCNRSDAELSHGPKLYRAQLCGRIRRTFAAWISSVRRYLLPRLEMRPRIDRPPVLYCRGTSPSQAAKSRPRSNASPLPIAATMAVEISGPDPGNTHQLPALSLRPAEDFNLAGDGFDTLVQAAPVFIEIADQLGRAGRDLFLSVIEYREERLAERSRADPDSNALLDQKGADLVDRRCSPRDQSRPHPMASLQVQLILALLLDEPQVRTQRRFGDRLGIVVIVLLPLHERLDVDRRDDPRLVPQRAQCPADKMRAQAGFHADDARRQLLEDLFEIQSPDPPPEGDLAVDAEPDEVKYVLADVDADDREWRRRRFRLWLHAASPVHRCQPARLAREGKQPVPPISGRSASPA